MQQLNEINFLRPIIIFLIVVLHSFTIYTGGWPLPEGIDRNFLYMLIARFSHSCTLETFTFISGYLFAYGIIERQKKYTLRLLMTKKCQHLMLPCVVFGILYLLLIEKRTPSLSFSYIYDVINGVAHLWFLPMLLGCFIFAYLLLHLPLLPKHIFAILFITSSLSLQPLPLQLSQTFYYLLFFYMGYYYRANFQKIQAKANVKRIVIFAVLFLLAFGLLGTLSEKVKTNEIDNYTIFYGSLLIQKLCKIIYSFLGIHTLYLTAVYFTQKYKLPLFIIQLNKYCFGIYLIHHFILPILYYKTQLPLQLGSYWLPWVGLIITLTTTIPITMLIRQTKIGRYLIG